jgi:hypothetical protein
VKRIIVVLIIAFVLVACGEQTEPLKPLDKGMPNTVTLSTGDVVYKIDGEWNVVTKVTKTFHGGEWEYVMKISQDGNKFVGIRSKDGEYALKGNETINGELEKNGFKSLSVKTSEGWKPATAKISENCNKIVYKAKVREHGLEITTTRK